MKSVELFAGAGGMAMGISDAGFEHLAVVEWNKDACDTIRMNQTRGVRQVASWPLHHADVRGFQYSPIQQNIELVAGGPPCQPFSLGGKHRGFNDHRDMFPEAVRAVRELRPKAFLFENVKGLLRESFSKYVEYIWLQLTFPEITKRKNEDWIGHLARLEKHHTSGKPSGLTYNVILPRVLNAADYGIPQKRERVFFVGFRSDLAIEWSFPEPTHSVDALLWDQWIGGEYWERNAVAKRTRPRAPVKLRGRIERLKMEVEHPLLHPWRTVRDVIGDLPDPEKKKMAEVPNHVFNPGARSYPGHTGSPLDEPAKTLKAGDHGVPGGENMLTLPNGKVRYFTVRESARLQTFPDEFVFHGSWSETMRQLGNAVPVSLAKVIAGSIAATLQART